MSKRSPATEPRILVVEDDVLVRFAIAEELRDLGAQVVETASGSEALDYLQSGGHIDVVFADDDMPGMAGLELARAIMSAYPLLTVLIAASHAEDVWAPGRSCAKAVSAGPDGPPARGLGPSAHGPVVKPVSTTSRPITLVEGDALVRHPLAAYCANVDYRRRSCERRRGEGHFISSSVLSIKIAILDMTTAGSGFSFRQWVKQNSPDVEVILANVNVARSRPASSRCWSAWRRDHASNTIARNRKPASVGSKVMSAFEVGPSSRASASGVRPDRNQLDHLTRRVGWTCPAKVERHCSA